MWHAKYLDRNSCMFLARVSWRYCWGWLRKNVQKYMSKYLDVHFIHTLPVLVASRHSRESGNPGDERHGDWMPAYAGMTFYWRQDLRNRHLGFGCWLDYGSEMLHALKAFVLALAAEIKDEFTDPEAAIRSNIRGDLLCRTGEGPTFESSLTLCGQRDIVEWGFIGDRERFWVASSRLGQAFEVT